MPVYNMPLTAIDMAETRRYAGLRGQTAFPEELLAEACSEALILSKPRGCWQVYAYDDAARTIGSPEPFYLKGEQITRHLAGATHVAVMAVTAGPKLDEAIEAHFAAGRYTAGLLLDAAGTTAVEMAADAVNQLVATQEIRRGLTAITRFSPGYGDWNIIDQPYILGLAGGEAIGIGVTASCMLLPRKSVTAVIGLVPGAKRPTLADCAGGGCKTCPQLNCLARKEN